MNDRTPPTSNRYSILALILSLLACIAAALLGVVRGLIATQVVTVASPENIQRWLLASAGIVILGLAGYAILEPDRVRRFLTGRQARYGSNALIMTIAFLGILIVGNALAFDNPVKVSDLTEDNENTLAPELTAALESLPEKVVATGFFAQGATATADQLLGNMKAASNGKFDYRFVNPDRDPQAAIEAGITGDGKILLEMGDQREIVTFASETEMLKGLLRLLNPGTHAIYFLTGHGERDIEQAGDASMTRARETLAGKNYTVKPLNLLAENQIPEDANAVVIAGPTQPISENEAQLLQDYLAQGGSLVVMQDPTILTEVGEEPDPLVEMLASDWGITLNDDVVIDLNNADPTTAISSLYDPAHVITRNMNNVGVLFPFTRSLTVAQPAEGITGTLLVQTNEKSWAEKDFDSLTQEGWPPSFEADSETQGPLTLVAAAENTTTGGRVVVFGTSNLAIDPNFNTYGNGDIFMNSVDWAAEQEDLTNLTPKTPTTRIFRAPGSFQLIVIVLGAVFIIPGLVVLAGISTWLSRKRQG